MPPELPALLAASGLALVHLAAGGLRGMDRVPRSRWLSAAGGVAVAYVFVHLLPELARAERHVGDVRGAARLGYVIALAGLAVFYGLERLALRSRRSEDRADDTDGGVFWVHTGSFALYNALIGYLLVHRYGEGIAALLVFALAMGVHFLVNDVALHEHHGDRYLRRGRWVLAGAVLLGWGAGAAVELPEAALGGVVAFLAGGIVLNVLKEELPEEREGRFAPLALGMAAYTALLLAV
jgi:hypothetical protein